jgi:transposase
MQKCKVIGIDLAKNVIQVCVVSKDGELISNKAISPQKLRDYLQKQRYRLSQWKVVVLVITGGDHI